jgi:prepilin-type N-terminal cleavage/methylation domain-containing protein
MIKLITKNYRGLFKKFSINRRLPGGNLPARRFVFGGSLSGFTLLEVVITIIILTIGVISICRAFSVGIFAHTDVENIDLALNIAQAKMEELKNTDFAGLVDSGPDADADFPKFNVTVNVAEGEDPMQVDVTVTWYIKGGEENVTLTTLMADVT